MNLKQLLHYVGDSKQKNKKKKWKKNHGLKLQIVKIVSDVYSFYSPTSVVQWKTTLVGKIFSEFWRANHVSLINHCYFYWFCHSTLTCAAQSCLENTAGGFWSCSLYLMLLQQITHFFGCFPLVRTNRFE